MYTLTIKLRNQEPVDREYPSWDGCANAYNAMVQNGAPIVLADIFNHDTGKLTRLHYNPHGEKARIVPA